MSKVDMQTSLGRILAKDLMHPKWSKGTQITEKMLKDMKDAGIERVNVETGVDESQDKILSEDVEFPVGKKESKTWSKDVGRPLKINI
jgi:hypothetical protein